MASKCGIAVLIATVALPTLALAAPSDTEVTEARTMAGGKAGGEAPLYMTVANHGGTADALQRVRCPVAWAAEPRVTDRGEGGLAGRAVKSIAIPANSTVKLEPGGLYVALLQLKEPLKQGDTFTCTVAFTGSGTKEVAVSVATEDANAK
jgi:copper(I)-binding protein